MTTDLTHFTNIINTLRMPPSAWSVVRRPALIGRFERYGNAAGLGEALSVRYRPDLLLI